MLCFVCNDDTDPNSDTNPNLKSYLDIDSDFESNSNADQNFKSYAYANKNKNRHRNAFIYTNADYNWDTPLLRDSFRRSCLDFVGSFGMRFDIRKFILYWKELLWRNV